MLSRRESNAKSMAIEERRLNGILKREGILFLEIRLIIIARRKGIVINLYIIVIQLFEYQNLTQRS